MGSVMLGSEEKGFADPDPNRFGPRRKAKPILDSLIQAYPPIRIVDSAIRACRGTDSQSPVLGSVLECYCKKGFLFQALEVYRKSIDLGYVLSLHSCNGLLDALELKNESRLGWCFYGNMLRNGVVPDRFTWSIVGRMLCKDGKFERIFRILDMGMKNYVMYNMIIDCYSKRGNFIAAFDLLNEMSNKNLDAGFSTYCSILDGACKYEDTKLIETTMCCMMEKGLLPKLPMSDCDLIIQKLSELGKTYAMDMFFKRACDEGIELRGASYGCMLREFSKEGRVTEAVAIYREMLVRDINVNDSCYNTFVNVLCKEDPSPEISGLLKETIGKGLNPCASEFSIYVTSLCAKSRWSEAEEILNAILEKGFLPDSSSCCSLVERYCTRRQIDSAIALHSKMEKMNGTLDVATYNVLLNGLIKERRVEEAIKVFDYMRTRELLSSASFSIVISGLCQEKALRIAMKMHDEMLKMGLKPDPKTYKRLISNFK
ncbi:pentatricopeptide repeat-containing protein At4g21170 [Actinidia eriantha]|uniref:pentatricopeptide repeat-containing protein At4g21170 n=1 Tax=Actinidia eriantha TaxID=165200 RepID=UPI002590E481|nr:pentatricopeptide repeat-containing protein At4g21170 [Actinidia eriantha]